MSARGWMCVWVWNNEQMTPLLKPKKKKKKIVFPIWSCLEEGSSAITQLVLSYKKASCNSGRGGVPWFVETNPPLIFLAPGWERKLEAVAAPVVHLIGRQDALRASNKTRRTRHVVGSARPAARPDTASILVKTLCGARTAAPSRTMIVD